jgi:hypothetical protein
MRRVIPVIVGVLILLVGVIWASQGAGVAGGGSYMDGNPTFVNLGGAVAVLGIILIALGALWKTKPETPAVSRQP